MTTPRTFVAVMAVCLIIPICGAAWAATILWDTPANTSSFSDIITSGSLIAAVNEGNDALTVDPGGLNISFTTANDFPNGIFTGAAPGVNTGDANFNTILNSASWSAPDPAPLTLSGLTPGNHYELQLFYTDTRGCCSGRSQTYTAGLSSPAISASGSGNGQFMVGTFTADSATQTINVSSSATDPTLNAYVVREVTTPPPPLPAGEVITPSFAEGTTPSYGSPVLLINGAGLLGAGPDVNRAHQTTHTQGWLKDNTNPANELVFSMPGPSDLNGMHVWQYAQAGCCTGRGVSTFDIQFSTDGGATYPTSMSLGPLNAASGTSNEMAQWVSFAEQTGVTHVKITNMVDFPLLPNSGWQGLNEVRFQGTSPTPPPTVTPAFAYGTTPSYGSPASLINEAGLLGVGPAVYRPHETVHTQGWLIDNTNPANELVFGMDGTADLDGMYVWQYSQGTCCTGRGVSTFEIQFSTDGGVNYSAPVSLGPLNAASGTSYEMAQLVSFAPQTGVTHVKISGMQDFPALPNPGWQGLNEVRFSGTLSPLSAPPEPGHLGNTVSFRAAASDGSDEVLWSNMYGAPVAGSVDSVEVFFQGDTRTFELFQLRPTGTANQFDVIARSGVITPDVSGTMTLPNGPFELQKGDMLFHYGQGIPFSDNLLQPTAHNNQNLYYPSPGAPTVGGPVTLGAGGFPLSTIRRDYAWSVQLPGFVETVGNGAGQGVSVPDTAGSILVVMDNDPFTQRGFLDTWQFFNDTAGTGGRNITPVLLRDTDGTVEILGIGTTRVGTENGFQQYDFDLVEGTDAVDPGDLFGFYYGDSQAGNLGSVEFTQIGSDNIRLFTQNLGDGLQITDVFTSPNWNLPRYYSINASTIVPEPATVLLLGLGGLGLAAAGCGRSRRRRRPGAGTGGRETREARDVASRTLAE